jgi:inosose dehydratase
MQLHHHLMTWQGYLDKNKLPFVLEQVLKEVKSAGYDGFEGGGDAASNGPAKEYAAKVAVAGVKLAAWGAGVTYNPWQPSTDAFQQSVDYAAELGVRSIVVCGGFMPSNRRTLLASDYQMFGDNLAKHARYAARHGQTLYFHPHVGCVVETAADIEALLKVFPELQLCIDTGHLAAVGQDPLAILERHAKRIGALHLKDWNVAEATFTELGDGNVDLLGVKQWIDRHRFSGPVIVERDAPVLTGLASATKSRAAWAQIEATAAAMAAKR